jgi:type VII secretion protein EccE
MTVRISLTALAVVAAVLAYPWQSTVDWWVLGVAAAILVVCFAWWRGLFVTTMVARRFGVWRRNHGGGAGDGRPRSEFATVSLRIDPSAPAELPLALIAGYVDRYGIRAHKVRVTSHDRDGVRTTWVTLTLAAAENLAALQARSARIPLHETAQIAGRRLTDHLREQGWNVATIEEAESPVPPGAKETWRGMRDESGYVAAYRVRVTASLEETLAAVAGLSGDTWAALEFTGTAANPTVSAGCAVRTAQRPGPGAPVPGLTPQRGRHRPALEALAPLSDARLEGDPMAPAAELLDGLRWPTGAREAVAAQPST